MYKILNQSDNQWLQRENQIILRVWRGKDEGEGSFPLTFCWASGSICAKGVTSNTCLKTLNSHPGPPELAAEEDGACLLLWW